MRITTGIDGLDKLIEGGFPEKTAILLSGGPGSGKTLLGMNFLLDGAQKGEKCCYVSLSENESELKRAAGSIDSLKSASKYMEKNLIFKHMNIGYDLNVKSFLETISEYPKMDRIVIDNVNKLLMFADTKKMYRMVLADLIKHLKEKVSCTLILCESDGDSIDTGNGEAFECDGALHLSFLELEEKPMRILRIQKLRYTDFEPHVARNIVISKKDIRMGRTSVI